MNELIESDDVLYEVLGTMDIASTNKEGVEVWKYRYGADSLLRNKDVFYFCRRVIDAEFEDIK